MWRFVSFAPWWRAGRADRTGARTTFRQRRVLGRLRQAATTERPLDWVEEGPLHPCLVTDVGAPSAYEPISTK